jgi:hypothetical protein
LAGGSEPMRRREFILGVGGAALWPHIAQSQQPAMPVMAAQPTVVIVVDDNAGFLKAVARLLALGHDLLPGSYHKSFSNDLHWAIPPRREFHIRGFWRTSPPY